MLGTTHSTAYVPHAFQTALLVFAITSPNGTKPHFIKEDIEAQRTEMSCQRFPGGSDGKVSACNAGDLGLILGLGRSPGEGNGKPLQYSCLENPMDGGAW